MRLRRTLLGAALASVFAVGCGLSLDFGPAVVNRCSGENQCGTGECVEGACVTTSLDTAMKVFFEVVPAPDALTPPRAPVVFAPVEIVGPTPVDLALPAETIVSGGAYYYGIAPEVDGERVPAQVTFTPRRSFAEAPAAQVRVTSDTEDYAVLLEAGTVYDVVVEPMGVVAPGLATLLDLDLPAAQALPPLYFEWTAPEGPTAAHAFGAQWNAALFSACTLLVQNGCTLGGYVKSVDAEGLEVAEEGLLVRAVDAAGRVVSSSTLTDVDGAFEIRITPGIGAYVLRVTPPEDVTLPTVHVAVDFELTATTREIVLPRLAPVSLQNYVGYYADGQAYSVDHAAVAFDGIALDDLGLPGDFSFRRTALTETPATGPSPFSLDVFPGTYRVVVTPADGERAGVLVFDLDIDPRSADPGIQGQNYLLPRRTRASGIVRTPSGHPLPFATIRARRLAPPATIDEGDIRRFGRSSDTTADGSGGYLLPLDVGTFDLVVRPGEGTGYAWHVFPGVVVEEDQVDFTKDLEVAPPVPVTGLVQDDSGEPLVGALVRAYVVLGTGEEARAVQVGEATTDETGAYDVLLPGGV